MSNSLKINTVDWEKFKKILEKEGGVNLPSNRNLTRREIDNSITQFSREIVNGLKKAAKKLRIAIQPKNMLMIKSKDSDP